MSGHQPNQPPRGWSRGGPPSPIHFRPPSPWAPSPPPIISGPRFGYGPPHAMTPPPQLYQQQHQQQQQPNNNNGNNGSRSNTPISPMFGASGLRGSRGATNLPCPRPMWPGPPRPPQSPHYPQQQQMHPMLFSPTPMHMQERTEADYAAAAFSNGPRPFRPPTYSPIPPSYARMSPAPSPAEYTYDSSSSLPYEYVGIPLEPPQPRSYVIYDDEEESGPSTAEIIANQSQDYVDEKLAEYQNTILQLQEEQERVQKKTFVNWINSYLSKRIPPLRINDLINDLRDGTKLLALLEILSGEKLPVERGRVLRRPHFLSNANTALQFLASKKIKLVNINPADLVDGRPPVVLGLVWTIILYFQIEENSRALEYLGHGISGSVSSLDSAAAATSSDMKAEKWKQGARKTLLQWVTNALPKDSGIEVRDFGASWRDGVAFLALIDAIKANLVNLAELKKTDNKYRLETAFDVAESKLGIARLLDAEDVDVDKPDEKSIMTYVAQFLHKYPEPKGTGHDGVSALQEEYQELTQWLQTTTSYYERLIETNALPNNFNEYLSAKGELDQKTPIYNKLKNLFESQNSVLQLSYASWEEIHTLWRKHFDQLQLWLWTLDRYLPGDFGVVGKWLGDAEELIHDNDIPNVMNEETASIISKRLEDHKTFFADLPRILDIFNAAKQSEWVRQVPTEQLQNMERRLNEIGPKAAQRRIRLKFLEHKCCLIAFLNLVENKLKTWTSKYGREESVEKLLEGYRNFVHKNKIFQEFTRAFIDMQQVVDEYKRDGNIPKNEHIQIDSFIHEIEEKWKGLSMELRCCQNMLEEVFANWKRWNALAPEFEAWLTQAEDKLKADEDTRLEFFQDISMWKDKHQVLSDTANFLFATCNDEIVTELRSRFQKITSRWDALFSHAKQYMQAGDILRNRKEYRQGAKELSDWLRHAESVLLKQPLGTTAQIKAYGEELQQLASKIEDVEDLFKTISKVFQSLIQDLSRDEVDRMMETLKKEKEALVKVRAQIPIKLHLFHQLLIQQESLEQGQREIHQWLDEGEALLSQLSLVGDREFVEHQLSTHRTFFSRTLYYKSMLESKNKVFQSLLKSVSNDNTIDTAEAVQKMQQLNDRFQYVTQNSQQWGQRLQESVRCWHNYLESERAVKEWLDQAEILLSERHIDSAHSVETQKMFFANTNERWISDLTQAAQDLLQCLPTSEHPRIVENVESLQTKWRDALQRAPPHLLKLECRLDETQFNHLISEIEKELHFEEQAMNKNEDVDSILKRNQEYFKTKGIILKVEKCLQNMERIEKTSLQYTPSDDTIVKVHKHAEQQWEQVAEKIDRMRKTLQQIPEQWTYYRQKFADMMAWMDRVDISLKNIMNEVNTMEEFDKERVVFQNICHEADAKREDMKWLVKTLDSLLPYATEDEAIFEQKNLEALIARYKNLIPTIEVTMVKTEVFSKCYTYKREVNEVVTLLNKVKDQTAKAPAPDSLDRVNKMIQEQQYAITQLDHQRTHIMSMLQRGKDLTKDVHAPAFVADEVKTLENGWNEAYSESVDKLKSLKGTQTVWSEFADQKSEILQLLAHAGTELRSITPLQTDPQNVSSDLKSKKELNIQLQQASSELMPRLQTLCVELVPLAASEKRPVIEKEVTEIEKQFFNTMEHVKDRVSYLEDYSGKWNTYKTRLAELQAWATQAAPQLIEALQSEDLSPEERVSKVISLQSVLSDKMRQLDIIGSDANELAPKEGNIAEAKRLKGEVFKLQEMLSSINRSVEGQAQAIKEDLTNWQKYQAEIKEIKPMIEESEMQVSAVATKPVTYQEALQLQQQAQQFQTQCEKQLGKLKNISLITSQMACKTNAPDELDAVQSRWISVYENAKQTSGRLDKLATVWHSFENDAKKLEDWIVAGEETLSKRPVVTNTPQIDKLEKELVRLKSFNNEISEQQAKLISLTQMTDQISLHLQPEGSVVLKELVNQIKTQINRMSEGVRAKINDVSDAIMARQDFNSQIVNFSNWMENLRRQIGEMDDMSTDKVDYGLQLTHALLQEHSDKTPTFTQINQEMKNLLQNALPEESLSLNESYTTLTGNYSELQSNLQQKQVALQKWIELLRWVNETQNHINHIKQQFDSSEKLEPAKIKKILEEIDEIEKSLLFWKDQAKQIDDASVVQIRDATTRKPLSAFQMINDLDNKVDDLKLKGTNKKSAYDKLEERKIKFDELEKELVQNINENKKKLKHLLTLSPDYSNIDQIIADLTSINEAMAQQQLLKNRVHDEGTLLIKDDISSMANVQESLLLLDKEWDGLQQEISDRINRYGLISRALKEYSEAKKVFDTEIMKTRGLFNALPTETSEEMQLQNATEKVKKILDSTKKAKNHLDEFDRKGGVLVKLFDSIQSQLPSEITDEIEKAHKDWQSLFDDVGKRLHQYETETVIWRQINEYKNELLPWLSEINQLLCSAADNTLEIEYGPLRLNKYRNELPHYLSMRDSVNEKIGQLKGSNRGAEIPSLDCLQKLIADELTEVERNALRLEEVTSNFNEQEKTLRNKIRSFGDSVNKLRESLIACDDMTGDNNKIVERLFACKNFKEQLYDSGDDLDNLKVQVDEMKTVYPAFNESTIPKELINAQKRFEAVIGHADKVESSLLTYLKKFHDDKLGMLQRIITTQKEKVEWCTPEASSDKYNLEVKKSSLNDTHKGIADCDTRLVELKELVNSFEPFDSAENLNAMQATLNGVESEIADVKRRHEATRLILEENINLWNQYEGILDNVTGWLKNIENKSKPESTNQIDLAKVDEKIAELKGVEKEVVAFKPTMLNLEAVAKSLTEKNPETRAVQFVGHLSTRYQNIAKVTTNSINRLKDLNETHSTYQTNLRDCQEWVRDQRNQFNELARMGSPGSGPTNEQLQLVKTFVTDYNKGGLLLNNAVEKGEALYPGITADNREKIRNELRSLREDFDNLKEEGNSLLGQIESMLLQKTSIEESYSQVQTWLSESKSKVGDEIELYPTLAAKKAAVHQHKNQLHDIKLQRNILQQLLDKSSSLNDEDTEARVNKSIKEYGVLDSNISKKLSTCENHVANHEIYDKVLERAQDWLTSTKASVSDVLGDVTFEKDGAEDKLIIVANFFEKKPDGSQILEAVEKQLQVVVQQTHPSGHPALYKSFEDYKNEWLSLIKNCDESHDKLKQLCSKWDEFEHEIDALEQWLKQIETTIKDQSLKNTLEAKVVHLSKLKEINTEIMQKSPEFQHISEQSHEIESDTELGLRVSRLSTRYPTLKNACKEVIARYEEYIKEHDSFNKDCDKFKSNLLLLVEELKQNNEIVGDLGILQEKQNKLKEMSEQRLADSGTFEDLIVRGEKLYNHTSPDGREIIRQQLRSLRTLWDNYTDDFSSTMQKFDHCLLQFNEFTIAQEQLTKWLKDVEKAMHSHTELKPTLQEKKAQFQNHKLMNQEIMAHSVLVESVCDKAQQLVDQTKDSSLNIYLQSIKKLFQDIVKKSQDLLESLGDCAQVHQNFNQSIGNVKNWIGGEVEKLMECDDTTGEKSDITRRLAVIGQLKKNKEAGEGMINDLNEQVAVVSKTTAPKGITILEKEMSEIRSLFDKHFSEINTVEDKLNAILQQWQEFDQSLDLLTKWCRVTEGIFRNQTLQSTIEEKVQQLDSYKTKRIEILEKQKGIDDFTDAAHTLLTNSSADRLKSLISQITNRYQLLHVLSKEVVNRWQTMVDDHKKYEDKLKEVNIWLNQVENQLATAVNDESAADSNVQLIVSKRDQAESLLTTVTSLGESTLPETSTQGREKIRQDLRDIRDRWEKLEDAIRNLQKKQEAQSLQRSSYNDLLQQVLTWLAGMEKFLQQEDPNSWTTTQEIRSKLFKYKTTLQEIISYKRIIENVTEKANLLIQNNASGQNTEIEEAVKDINTRYDATVKNCTNLVDQLEKVLDVYQTFNDKQKSQQDSQKNLWDRLTSYSEYSGNKAALQSRIQKIIEIQDSLQDGKLKLKDLEDHIQNKTALVPARSKEAMSRDLSNLTVDFDKFSMTLNDVKSNLEIRLQQWNDFEANLDRLIAWLTEAEVSLKHYALKSTFEEKEEQQNKYQGLLMNLRQNEAQFDKITDESAELIQNSGETRISTNVQQMVSRFQAIQATAKEIVKNCEQAVVDHQNYNDKYKQCSDWVAAAQGKYDKCESVSEKGSRQELLEMGESLKELLSQQASAIFLLNTTVEFGEKLYPNTAIEGRETVRLQLEELQQMLDQLFDKIGILSRMTQGKLTKWSGFEESAEKLQSWLNGLEKQLPSAIELKTTLDEKRSQLQVYRDILIDIQSHQMELVNLKDIIQHLPEKNKATEQQLAAIDEQYNKLLKRGQGFVEQYEAIVTCHQHYSKAVMDTQEFINSNHNTIDLWGDLELEKISLITNLDRLRNLQQSLAEESPRIDEICTFGEKVLPGTVESGKVNIQSQIDSSRQEWEGLLSSLESTIKSIESKLFHWNEYEKTKDQCIAWIRDTDNKLHTVDLKATLQEKKDQLDVLKALQGDVRAKELEIDNVSEKAQLLSRSSASSRQSQVSDLVLKYQQISHKVKDLNTRWQQYVTSHQEFENQIGDWTHWLQAIRMKLDYCSDLSATSQKDLEAKMATIQDLLLLKDEGFAKSQSLIELAQNVLANTAPQGHDAINKMLAALQEEWSILSLKMADTKASLDDTISKWSGFLEQIQVVNKSVESLEGIIKELSEFQTTMNEKRTQLERIKSTEEKMRLEKMDVDILKKKAAEMVASGQQSQAAYQAQQILGKFDSLFDTIKKLLNDREEQYRDHRLYKESYDDLNGWISRAREKMPSMKQKTLSDKLAIESAVTPLDALLNKKAQGDLLVEHLTHTGQVVLASTSPQGKEIVNNDIRALRESFESLFREVSKQKEQLETTLAQWREYKEEYEKLSEWLQQIDILVKNNKLTLMPNLEEKHKQTEDMKNILDRLVKGQADIDRFNKSASSLLSSHLDTYVNNQLRHLNSRYQVQVNLAKDVLKKVETNYAQHKEYDQNHKEARDWIENAREAIRASSEASSASSKELLQQRLNQISDLIKRREQGQNLVHVAVNNGEKVQRNTRSDGKEIIYNQIKELQTDWDRLVKKMSTAKVHLETSLLQWADYSSSYTQLQQWITDREAKLQQVCEQKVVKSQKGQQKLSTGLNERKGILRQTNNIVQDIVSFEPMIQSVTSKASDLLQGAPATEISAKYETLTKTAKDLYEKQKEAVEQHQALIDAENEFIQWLRNAKERLSKCSEPTGDKEGLASKITQLKVLDNEVTDGQGKLNKALEQGEIACHSADADDRELIEEEVAFLQDEFDNYVDALKKAKSMLEVGIVKWTEYEDLYKDALDWLTRTDNIVQSFNKLQDSLEQKKNVLEQFQIHLQTLFDWQKDLDCLNMRAQSLLETCADTRISNAITQLTTKYNALLSLAKEVMRRLELHYQEHQQHHALYEECQHWIEKTREKLNECQDIPSTISEVHIKLNTVKTILQGFEQGQNKVRYIMELKERVIMNTESNGAAKIQEDTESLKQEFEKLLIDITDVKQKLTSRAAQLEEIYKLHKILSEWLEEIEPNVQMGETCLNDLSEKKSSLEKFRNLLREINSHSDMVEKINTKIEEDRSLDRRDFEGSLKKFEEINDKVVKNIEYLENQVNNHEKYRHAFNEIYEWIRKTKMDISQCSDSHGERDYASDKLNKLRETDLSMPEGKILMENTMELSRNVIETSGSEGQDIIRQEMMQLKADWDSLQQLSKDAHDSLNNCLSAWDDYLSKFEKISRWIADYTKRVNTQAQQENKSPEDLEKCKNLLKAVMGEKDAVEELNDVCEVLMEQSACSRVRDQTVETQANYTKLLTAAQGLVAKVEKNLSDHTEFLNYKNEMEKWLARANENLAEYTGTGDINEMRDKLNSIQALSNRLPEGQHILSSVQEAFTKASHVTPEDKQDKLRSDMNSLKKKWDKLNATITETLAALKVALGRWEDYHDTKNRLNSWIDEMEATLKTIPDSRGELSEMKTLLEKYKFIINEIANKASDIDHIKNEAKDLSVWLKISSEKEDANKIQARWEKLKNDAANRLKSIENEIEDYNSYHQKLQDAEKWLLQISFQLMAHNSLYITNREQTIEQISQHEVLLDEIQRYQNDLDDLNSKGQVQIERYESETPAIRNTIETQMRNIQESYNSLLNTSVQIRNRLQESLAKFQEYEDTLDSILHNLDVYEPIISTELDEPATTLEAAQHKLKIAQNIHNKLQNEKTRLAVAVQACEAATASISRPSSPLEVAMAPIPEKELTVRARIEDLIDQVQGALGGLATTVSELEQLQKQRSELFEWIRVKEAVVSDWSSRPSKLRSEAAKQELVAMNDLLNAIGDKRSQIMTEMTGTFADDDSSDIEQQLDILERDLMDTIARKSSGQNVIEDYRQTLQGTHGWLDAIIKRMDQLEKGSGLNCGEKLDLINGIRNEFETESPSKLDTIKQKAQHVNEIISNLDAQQVEEQLKSVERRFNDIAKRIDRKAQVLEMTNKGVDSTRNEIENLHKWIKDALVEVQTPAPLGYESKAAEARQQKLKGIIKEAEGKQSLADTLEKRVFNMQNELEPVEQNQLESLLSNVNSDNKQLLGLLKAEANRSQEAIEVRKKLELDLEKAKAWLKAKLADVRKQPKYQPLTSAGVDEEITVNKKHGDQIKEFSDGLLNDVLKKGANLLKECPDGEKGALEGQLKEINELYDTLQQERNDRLKSLNDLYGGRKSFENEINQFSDWLNEAEANASGDIQTSLSLPGLQDQVVKYETMRDNAKSMDGVLNNITDQSRAIVPTLNSSDKLKLSDQLKGLKDRYNQVSNSINDKLNLLQKQMQKYKDAKAKFEEYCAVVSKLQQDLKDLNKPVGSKVEDVQVLLGAYEKILKDIKDNKMKMNELEVDNLPELSSILQQQDDMIKLVDHQLAHLKQLLLLREQFIALINDIIAFIMKYTEIVIDIEKSPEKIEEKIKKYDDIILKIQECDALLASAADKGEQIASEGTAADRNSITEQIQSLKNQLQKLRNTVEEQRQRHELILAEHRQMANDLREVLNWLHENEALVKSRPLLERDPDSVEREVRKHDTLATDVQTHLDKIQKIYEQSQHAIGIPGSLSEMISEGRSLCSVLPTELDERRKYLCSNQEHRLAYMKLCGKFNEWVHETEMRLQTSKHGIDFEHILIQLEEHKQYFSNDQPIRNLIAVEIQKATDNIWPSLSTIDQEELSREFQHHQQVLKNTLNSIKNQRVLLEQGADLWKEYQLLCEKVEGIRSRFQFNDEPIANLAGLQFTVQKISHILKDIQSQQGEIDVLNQKAQEIQRQSDPANRDKVEQQNNDINRKWRELISGLENRREQLQSLADLWANFDNKQHALESQLIRLEERSRHVEPVVRSRRQLEDIKNVIQELFREFEELESTYQEVTSLSKSIIAFLGEVHKSSAEALQGKLDQLAKQHKGLKELLHEKDTKNRRDLEIIEEEFASISDLQDKFNSLIEKLSEIDVFDPNQAQIAQLLEESRHKITEGVASSVQLISTIKQKYIDAQNFIPSDIDQELTSLELLSERLRGVMEEKDREFKRARTIRSDYQTNVDAVHSWIQSAEARIQNKGLEPLDQKEVLHRIHGEINDTMDKLDAVKKNGQTITEKSKSPEERERIAAINTLTEQMNQIRALIEDKRTQVGEILDAWTKFMNLYQIVMAWCSEKNSFLAEPLNLTTLQLAKQKMTDYSNGVKSIKAITKNLNEMDKEFEQIQQITTATELRDKLQEAEEAKSSVEVMLLERNALLMETAEEWEQCEKKLKEVRQWIEKTNASVEAQQNKKKPLRDQLGLCEKLSADVTIQRTKIELSIEKLKIHFRSGIGGDPKIVETSEEILENLIGLNETIRSRSGDLERSIAQLDNYQQQIQQLRQKIMQEEQQLRLVLAPTYLPHDRDKALAEQQACRERVKILQTKINARNERIKLLVQRGSPDDDPLDTK